MANYWVVGTNWAGDDQAERFYSLGKWEVGWASRDIPEECKERIKQMTKGDRIAVKHRNGKGAKDITIVALGVIKAVEGNVVYVDWLVKNLDRKVPSKGCFKAVHGPYEFKDAWTRKVFCL